MHFSSSSRAPGVLAREDRPPEGFDDEQAVPTSSPRRVNTVLSDFEQVRRHVPFATQVQSLLHSVTSVSVYRVAWFVIVKRNLRTKWQEEQGKCKCNATRCTCGGAGPIQRNHSRVINTSNIQFIKTAEYRTCWGTCAVRMRALFVGRLMVFM